MSTNDGGGWFRRLFSRSKTVPLDPTRDDLVVVASSFDDAESCSAALDRGTDDGGFVATKEAVLRHHLVLPSDTVSDAAAIAAQDGYALVEPAATITIDDADRRLPVEDGVSVTLQRVQIVDALHCSQERSRMAGLAQRRGGIVLGWDALQPGADATERA
ncbi:hypothetical protein HQ346_08770 [Rhodococcus sp. BP-252]|nr:MULTISPECIES: hypothetical protein [Rhodococcus]MBY6411393.1 hypothetical protein [Rhodococcus sp. BP-320]MBY6416052.1 hypothetical protein [Rhodococcus sp. BP-321]MBY6420439.1 hypothetical protein [Rhodococcus sp. BP-324]MBY6426259.1 hypothetical protein [Rhodococcus sp. BP-323]MBY6431200.1 hypothetical protein [Rhodococcus sp. BP-322]